MKGWVVPEDIAQLAKGASFFVGIFPRLTRRTDPIASVLSDWARIADVVPAVAAITRAKVRVRVARDATKSISAGAGEFPRWTGLAPGTTKHEINWTDILAFLLHGVSGRVEIVCIVSWLAILTLRPSGL